MSNFSKLYLRSFSTRHSQTWYVYYVLGSLFSGFDRFSLSSPCQKLKKKQWKGLFYHNLCLFLILILEDAPRDESDERNSLKQESITEHKPFFVDPDVMEVKKEVAMDCETFSFSSNNNPRDIFLLKHLKPKCKDVEVIFNEEKGETRLKGPKGQLDTAIETFRKQDIVIDQKELRSLFSTGVLELLETNEGQKVVKRTFQQKEIQAIVLFDETSRQTALYAKNLGDAEKAIACIRELVAEKEVILDDSDLRLTTTTEWLQLVKKLHSDEGVFLHVGSSSDIYVVTGFSDNVANAITRLQEFVNENRKVEGNYECRTEGIREYIEKYCEEDLRLIAMSLEEFSVSFKKGENRMLYMTGRRKGLELAKTKLDELTNRLVLRCFEERQPGLRKYVEENRKGKRWMKTVEHNCKCRIKVHYFLENEQGTCCFVTSEGPSISCKIGDIVSEKVHYFSLFSVCIN